MWARDQALRLAASRSIRLGRTRERLATVSAVARSDRQNQTRLGEILRCVGWPPISLFGKEADECAFGIAAHAPSVAFQKRCIGMLRSATRKGEAANYHYAFLSDRVATREGRRQRFGTQVQRVGEGEWVVLPLQDGRRVEAWRRRQGLPTIQEQCRTEEALLRTRGRSVTQHPPHGGRTRVPPRWRRKGRVEPRSATGVRYRAISRALKSGRADGRPARRVVR